MALVLRKLMTPRNMMVLRCSRGRFLTTVVNKRTTQRIAKYLKKRTFKGTTSWLSLKRELKFKDEELQEESDLPLHAELAGSCFIYHDSIKAASEIKGKKALSYLNYRKENEKMQKEKLDKEKMDIAKKMASVCAADVKPLCNPCTTCASCGACAPCCCGDPCAPGCCPVPPAPCGCGPCGCTCLPAPSDCPPKCLQNMLGYYYYPYGTWFCGPYHQKVSCPGGPCDPCKPCSPCGPCCAVPACAVCTPPTAGPERSPPCEKPSCPTPCPACVVPGDLVANTSTAAATTVAATTVAALGVPKPPVTPKQSEQKPLPLTYFITSNIESNRQKNEETKK